jgi:ParB-like nuclease domain
MPNTFEPHPLATLFPELAPDELAELASDIKARGQLEPIILYKGRILDGRNRYRACQIAGVKPQTEDFDAKATKRTPEELVLSRNLRRRHLTVGQKAAIALDWSELSPEPERNKERGRPKGTLSKVAKKIGINEQRVFEVRQIRGVNPSLYQDVKAGRCSLNSALAKVRLSNETRSQGSDVEKYEPKYQEPDWGAQNANGDNIQVATVQMQPIVQPVAGKASRGVEKFAIKKEAAAAVKLPPSPAAIEKALARIKAILGSWFYAEVKARNLIQKPDEIVQFAKLTDLQMREIGSLLKRGWIFTSAFREVIERLTPDDEIRALHTRAVAKGGNCYLSSVGDFGHIVVWGSEKGKILAELKDILARLSAPEQS